MTVSFRTLLIVWMNLSSLAVRLDDDDHIHSDDFYQNDAKGETDELASNDICPTTDHPHLDHFIKRLGADEIKWWGATHRKARLKAPKNFENAWNEMFENTTDDGSDEAPLNTPGKPGLECQCCFKHPIVVKVGARLTQHMFPDLAEFLDDHIDNITATLKEHPDHTVEHMVRQLNESKNANPPHSESLVTQSWFSSSRRRRQKAKKSWMPTTCQLDVVNVVFDLIFLIIPMKALNPSSAAKTVSSNMYVRGAKEAAAACKKAVEQGLGPAGGARRIAKMVGTVLYNAFSNTKVVYKSAVSEYKKTLKIWNVALMVVKMTAQIAVWFLSGSLALIATIVAGIAGLLYDVTKLLATDQCYDKHVRLS